MTLRGARAALHDAPCSTSHVALVLVAELPQSPDDDPQKRDSCAWEEDELITIDA